MDKRYVLARFEELEEELRSEAYERAQSLALDFLELDQVDFWEDIPKAEKKKWEVFCNALDDKKLLTSGCRYLHAVMTVGQK
ncbi:MAG: hypothetical protein VW226_08490 [Rhodospirillaceae bacterium]|jgi:phage regulator Rha-like protein